MTEPTPIKLSYVCLMDYFMKCVHGTEEPDEIRAEPETFIRLITWYMKLVKPTHLELSNHQIEVLARHLKKWAWVPEFHGAFFFVDSRLPKNIVHISNSKHPGEPKYNFYVSIEEQEAIHA